MRRWSAFTTAALLATCLTIVVGPGTQVASANPSAPIASWAVPGTTWTLSTGSACESETFQRHGAFDATGNDTGAPNGDAGTVRRSDRRGSRLDMTWTVGADKGAWFSGRYDRREGEYVGTSDFGGVSAPAEISPSGTVGCPVLSATLSAQAATLGQSDSVTVSVIGSVGAPTGSVQFWICSASPCNPASGTTTPLPTETLSGTDNTASATVSSPPLAGGSSCFAYRYGGDDHDAAVFASPSGLCATVSQANPTITASLTDGSVELGKTVTDTVTLTGLTGGPVPTGDVSFYLCGPEFVPESCAAAPSGDNGYGSVPLVAGLGQSKASTDLTLNSYDWPGTYCFLAVYSGDASYLATSESSTADQCVTETSAPAPYPDAAVMALNRVDPHEVVSSGTSTLVVSGDVLLNTSVPSNPWSGSRTDPTSGTTWTWDDAIDSTLTSNLDVYGTILSQNDGASGYPPWPLDTCFAPNVVGDGDPPSSSQVAYAGDPAVSGAILPSNQLSCDEYGSSHTVDYDNISPTQTQIEDPLQSTSAPADPLSPAADISCPGSTTATFDALPAPTNGVTDLEPGIYTSPVEITGSAVFETCPNGSAGIYRFDQGLWIDPQSPSDTVTGSNVVLAAENPYPAAGNVPGSVVSGSFEAAGAGNGAPCLPSSTMTNVASGYGSAMTETNDSAPCGGTDPTAYGVIAYGDSTFSADATMSGTGSNFSVMIGGALGATVSLTGPTTGPYAGTNGNPGIVLYQDPYVEANYGFDAETGDAANITIDGVVYNASLPRYGALDPEDYWDGTGGGIPFYAGGTLQAGYGTGWSNGPAPSAGSVTLTGSAIVDDVSTEGATTVTVLGQPFALTGAPTSGHRRPHESQRHRHRSVSVRAPRRGREKGGVDPR
jgi:hypothetical protein